MKRTLSPQAPVSEPVTPDLYTGEPPLQSAHKVWSDVQRDLSYALGANIHRSWTGRLVVRDACERTITLSAPSRFIASKIESQYADTLRRLWSKYDVVAPPRDVLISTVERAQPRTRPPAPSLGSQLRAAPEASEAAPGRAGVAARHTFENFVVGPSNELAFAVARKIATSNSPAYNPVVIHAANGMGKTHLLQAVRHHIETCEPDRRAHFISSEQFVNSFVKAFRASHKGGKGGREGIEDFKSSLRDVDLLIIDDAHFIADKPGSQEELLHTLVSLVDAGRQILIASDRHPDQIEKASPRLRSYLSSGLVVKINPANYDLRLRILDHLIATKRAKAKTDGARPLTIPKNARDHLAARINATPRDLEGAFNQVIAQAEFLGTPITLETIQETLSDSRYATAQRLTVDRIQRAVCEAFDLQMSDMTSKRRARAVARPRQVAMYLSKTLTKRSLPDIGRRFGGRDHTTVMHAVRRIEELRADDPVLDGQVKALEATLTGQ